MSWRCWQCERPRRHQPASPCLSQRIALPAALACRSARSERLDRRAAARPPALPPFSSLAAAQLQHSPVAVCNAWIGWLVRAWMLAARLLMVCGLWRGQKKRKGNRAAKKKEQKASQTNKRIVTLFDQQRLDGMLVVCGSKMKFMSCKSVLCPVAPRLPLCRPKKLAFPKNLARPDVALFSLFSFSWFAVHFSLSPVSLPPPERKCRPPAVWRASQAPSRPRARSSQTPLRTSTRCPSVSQQKQQQQQPPVHSACDQPPDHLAGRRRCLRSVSHR